MPRGHGKLLALKMEAVCSSEKLVIYLQVNEDQVVYTSHMDEERLK
jgi:hypothetical protein